MVDTLLITIILILPVLILQLVFNNGIILQWVNHTGGGYSTTIYTFPISFSNKNYGVAICGQNVDAFTSNTGGTAARDTICLTCVVKQTESSMKVGTYFSKTFILLGF